MHFEVPELKRFCFCLPLRYGLIVWGYLSLFTTILFLYWRIATLITLELHEKFSSRMVLLIIYVALGLFDGVVNIIFILAAHLKRVKLLKISLLCNIIFLSFYIIGFLYSFINLLYLVFRKHIVEGWEDVRFKIELVMSLSAMPFIRILFEFYALLLLWNEIRKLTRKDRPIMFINRAAEARYMMESELRIDVEENGKEDEIQTADVIVEVIEATTDDSAAAKGMIENEFKIDEEKEREDDEIQSETAEILVEVIETTPDNLSYNVVDTELFDGFDNGTAQNPKVMEDDFEGEGLGFEPW